MKVTDFDYDLPKERIAQHPMEPRDHSRLLVVDKNTGAMEHRHFYNLPEYLRPGDLLVFNDTRVIPARLFGYSAHSWSQNCQSKPVHSRLQQPTILQVLQLFL